MRPTARTSREIRATIIPDEPLPSGVITAMFTDIAGSTKLKGLMPAETQAKRDVAYRSRIAGPHDAIILPLLERHQGRIVNRTGDGFCCAFDDPQEAVLCALEIQEALAKTPIETGTELGRLQVRIGLHTGCATPTAGDIISATTDKAARVQGAAAGGQVLVSRETCTLATAGLRGVGFESIGSQELKGLGREELFVAFRSGANPFVAAEADYRQHVVDRFGKLTLYSVSSDAPLAVDLERVFVKLTATQQRTMYRGPGLKEPAMVTKHGRHGPGPAITTAKDAEELEESLAKAEETTVTLSVNEALRAHLCLAIIGAPGAGKTTLLKYLALTFARRQAKPRLELEEERLPVFVALRDFNQFLNKLAKASELMDLGPELLPRFLGEHTRAVAPHLSLPGGFFERALARGECAVLLDGLDEVADPIERGRAAEAVARVVGHYANNRFVVTSRPHGYESEARQRLSPLCGECAIREFDEADRAAFAQAWYIAVVTDRQGDTPTARDEAAAKAKDLLRAIQADLRIAALASNPLLLSVLAMVHQRGVGLPQRRVDLFDECTQMLLGYWDQVRDGDAARELAKFGGLNRLDKRSLLEPLALWLHQRGEKGLEVDEKDLETQIARQFSALFGDPEPQARQRAKLFLRVIKERAGLLVERESGVYAFAHLTFQEYFAARALADRDDYIEYTVKRLHEPWWREVILLAAGHLSSPNTRRARDLTTALIKAIANAGSWLEKVLRRDLMLAARALADIGPLGVDDSPRQDIITKLIALWRETPYRPQRQEVEALFAYAMPSPDGQRIRQELLALTKDKSDDLRGNADDALGRMGQAAATPETLARLLELSWDKSKSVRGSAAFALGQMGQAAATPEILARLVELSQDQSDQVRHRGADALGRMGQAAATPETLARLVELSRDKSEAVREYAAYALGQMGQAAATPETLARLVELSRDQSEHMRAWAAEALGQMGQAATTPGTLARLVELSRDQSEWVRGSAALALGQMGQAAATPETLACLVELSRDPSEEVRRLAPYALGEMGQGAATPETLAHLVELIQDESREVRRRAAEALGQMAQAAATPKSLARLLEVTLDQSEWVRCTAAYALGRMGQAAATPETLARLVKLSRDRSELVRCAAAYALGRLGQAAATPETLARLVKLSRDRSELVRRSVAEALVQIGQAATTPETVARLVELSRDRSDDVRLSAAWALRRMSEASLKDQVVRPLAGFWTARLGITDHRFFAERYARVSDVAYEELRGLAAMRAQRRTAAEDQ
jgi:HEAT repeat protein/class 3 adenylate cyclase/energy-coupling factor transporter ATP-binding protein EcfA2